jgi:hypothetical protein
MRDLNLLVWLTQLGLSVAFPLAGFVLLAVWLRDSCGWGGWVIWAGLFLGISAAVSGFRSSLKAMQLFTKSKNKEQPPVSFNDHD